MADDTEKKGQQGGQSGQHGQQGQEPKQSDQSVNSNSRKRAVRVSTTMKKTRTATVNAALPSFCLKRYSLGSPGPLGGTSFLFLRQLFFDNSGRIFERFEALTGLRSLVSNDSLNSFAGNTFPYGGVRPQPRLSNQRPISHTLRGSLSFGPRRPTVWRDEL